MKLAGFDNELEIPIFRKPLFQKAVNLIAVVPKLKTESTGERENSEFKNKLREGG